MTEKRERKRTKLQLTIKILQSNHLQCNDAIWPNLEFSTNEPLYGYFQGNQKCDENHWKKEQDLKIEAKILKFVVIRWNIRWK